MGDGTKEIPYTREDVRNKIKEIGTAEGLDLSEKVFEESIDLRGLDLVRIILKKAVFLVSVQLELADSRGAQLEGADLRGAHLEGASLEVAYLEEADLRNAHLEGTSLGHAHLEGANLHLAHLERASLVNAHLEGAILMETHLEGAYLWDANLKGADLESTHLVGAYLHDVQFSTDTRLEVVDWGDYILGDEKVRQFDWAEDTYRRLKQWYTTAGIHDTASEFFYREMEAKRKAQSWKKEPLSKLWYWVIKLLCGYGERYGNVVVAALVIIFGLAIVYIFGGLNLAYAIYFSAVSFTALGYGSWAHPPAGWIQGLGAAESFLGVFMMALFLITFIRKMTR